MKKRGSEGPAKRERRAPPCRVPTRTRVVRARLARVQPGPLDLVQEITCGHARSRIAAARVKTVLTYMANGTPGPLWQSRFSRVARRMTSVVRTHLELCALGPWPSKTDCTLSYRRRCHKRPQVTGDAVGGCGRGTAPSTSAAIRVWGRRTESMACQAIVARRGVRTSDDAATASATGQFSDATVSPLSWA